MQIHFVKHVQGADITQPLRQFAASFFSEAEKLELRKNLARLEEVLEALADLKEHGPRGPEAFKEASARIAEDEGIPLAERLAALEKLREEDSKRPDREAALHVLETRLHANFIDPAKRLAQAFLVPLAELVAEAERTEKSLTEKFGIPMERIEGALVEPMRRALEATRDAKFEPGGSASWLQRAGMFLPISGNRAVAEAAANSGNGAVTKEHPPGLLRAAAGRTPVRLPH